MRTKTVMCNRGKRLIFAKPRNNEQRTQVLRHKYLLQYMKLRSKTYLPANSPEIMKTEKNVSEIFKLFFHAIMAHT